MIIGLSGYAQAGKDEVAKILVEHADFHRIAMADPLREFLQEIYFRFGLHKPYWVVVESFSKFSFDWPKFKIDFPLIYRTDLQWAGTELGRETVHRRIWVEALKERLYTTWGPGWHMKDFVIPDIRFMNELEWIVSNGGELWKIQRPGIEAANDHKSEHEWESWDFWTQTLDNDGTIENLTQKVGIILIAEGIRALD